MMKIIALGLLTFMCCGMGCAQVIKNTESQAKPNQESNTELTIDRKKARELSDSITEAIIEDRYKDIYTKMGKTFREAITEKGMKPALNKLYSTSRRPLEVKYKMDDTNFEMFNGQKRPIRIFYYVVRTSKKDNGTYFLIINIVLEENSLVCSTFFFMNYSNDEIPPQLQ